MTAEPFDRDAEIVAFEPTARLAARRFSRNSRPGWPVDYDDMVAIARIAACLAAEKYDPSRGKSFRAYAWWHAVTYIRAELIASRRLKRAGRAQSETDLMDRAPEGFSLAEIAVARPEQEQGVSADLATMLGVLSDRERGVVRRHHLGGETLESIAASQGVTRQRIGQVEQGAMRKLRDAAEAMSMRGGAA